MSLTLSSKDLSNLQAAVDILISPLASSSVDQWRASVCGVMKALFEANTAGFILPVPDGPFVYSDDHDREALNAFPELLPPACADGRSIYEVGCERGVSTIESVYDYKPEAYFEGAYYNEFALPNGAGDTCGMLYALDPENPWAFAALQLWQDRRGLLGERELALGRLLYPAFKAGVETQIMLGQQKAGLLRTFDELGHSLAVIDADGHVLHQTPSLIALLVSDPEAEFIRVTLKQCARTALDGLTGERRAERLTDLSQTISTMSAAYDIRTSIYYGLSSANAPTAVVAVHRVGRQLRTAKELELLYGLTPTESSVALLIGRGLSNSAIARELTSSPHTVRRHTEKVFQKLNVRSRAQVAALLLR